jgi:hypothetical protein
MLTAVLPSANRRGGDPASAARSISGGLQALSRRPPVAKPNRQIGRATFYIPFPRLASKIR